MICSDISKLICATVRCSNNLHCLVTCFNDSVNVFDYQDLLSVIDDFKFSVSDLISVLNELGVDMNFSKED